MDIINRKWGKALYENQSVREVKEDGHVHDRGMYPKAANVVRPAILINIDI